METNKCLKIIKEENSNYHRLLLKLYNESRNIPQGNIEYELIPQLLKDKKMYIGISIFFYASSDEEAKQLGEELFKCTEMMVSYELWNNHTDKKIFFYTD